MPLVTCRTCGTRFTGFECPDCGRRLSSRGCLAALVLLTILFAAVSLVFPAPPVPSIEHGSGEEMTFVFESTRHARREIFRLILFSLFLAVLVCRIPLPHDAPPTPSNIPGLGGASAMMFGSLGRILRTFLLLLLLVVLLCLAILKPLGEYRALTVTDSSVLLQTLYHEREVPLERIARIDTNPPLETLENTPRFDLRLLIETDSRRHRSVRMRFSRSQPRHEARLGVLRTAIEEIRLRKDRVQFHRED